MVTRRTAGTEMATINSRKRFVPHGRSNEYPLFIYFMCSVAYPDGSMDTFPVTFLPTCVKEVLREDHHQSKKFGEVPNNLLNL
ncbi:unnamed protein product [Nippostrongylus brasiliensis]|uniref:Uncharacterized protein n=1 Tax=Nippostrongylus brasiliensis TaxID=27835 RepID=A0A0N4YU45_NIPBR|nr:unnamed protein product [Nippostrongylus brasiliensis]